MNNKISLKSIYKLLLKNKKALILGQIFTVIGILISVPIPLLLPLLVDEVLLNKPDFFVNNINELFGSGNAFYYVAIVTAVVICLRAFHLWEHQAYLRFYRLVEGNLESLESYCLFLPSINYQKKIHNPLVCSSNL